MYLMGKSTPDGSHLASASVAVCGCTFPALCARHAEPVARHDAAGVVGARARVQHCKPETAGILGGSEEPRQRRAEEAGVEVGTEARIHAAIRGKPRAIRIGMVRAPPICSNTRVAIAATLLACMQRAACCGSHPRRSQHGQRLPRTQCMTAAALPQKTMRYRLATNMGCPCHAAMRVCTPMTM